MTDLLAALAIAIFIEGAAFALFPQALKNAMAHALAQPVTVLRTAGLIAALAAVALLWIVRS